MTAELEKAVEDLVEIFNKNAENAEFKEELMKKFKEMKAHCKGGRQRRGPPGERGERGEKGEKGEKGKLNAKKFSGVVRGMIMKKIREGREDEDDDDDDDDEDLA